MSQHLVFLPSLYSLFSGIQEPAKKISHFHTVILLVKVSHQNFDANNFPVTQTFGTSINIYTDKISLGAFYKRALQITDYFFYRFIECIQNDFSVHCDEFILFLKCMGFTLLKREETNYDVQYWNSADIELF